ncbi:MAG: oligonucleotide/oligosaccharide-binding fold domain-containing protein [Spirochaetia bacterium]
MISQNLPVYQERERIIDALKEHQVIVVESPTGSGKTTQLPLILHEAGYAEQGVIGVTQPRRIATLSVCDYISNQLNSPVGGFVGYKMRFEDETGPDTRVKIMTDGILLQEMKADYYLSEYGAIIVDEAHERSLNIDFILGLLKRVLEERPNFRVIVSSATINAEVFSEYFWSCPVVRIDTPMYPVKVVYSPPQSDTYEGLLETIRKIVDRSVNKKETPGDFLIFLSGEKMIKDCIDELGMIQNARRKLHILPLYSRLSKEEQERVFPPAPAGKTKVVVATNIAETSVTIDGITQVIDSGLAKMNFYNPRTYTSSLIEGPISQASSNQRKGRAGRTRPGTCYRLYYKEDFEHRSLFTLEEIFRTDLSEVVLRMAEIGITEFDTFNFISPPPKAGILGAVETLRLLEALTPENTLSSIGRMMARFPLLPKHSRMIVAAIRTFPGVIREVITATSFLTAHTPFILPQGEEVAARKAHHSFRDDHGDFVSYLKLLKAYKPAKDKDRFCETYYLDRQTMDEIANIETQLSEIVSEMNIPLQEGGPVSDFLCACAKGLIQFVCARSGKWAYRSLTAEKVQIHPGSVLFKETPQYIVAGEIVRTSKMWARSVSPLEESWLPRISPEIARNLMLHGKGNKKTAEKKRDTTWQIKIGAEIFTLEPYKGKKKKIALLPWDSIAREIKQKNAPLIPQYNNLRGRILYGNYTLLNGYKLKKLIPIIRHFDLPRDLETRDAGRRRFSSGNIPELCVNLDRILKIRPVKKGSTTLGFTGLFSDSHGGYILRTVRNFSTAVTESLSSLEILTDELPEDLDETSAESLNRTYRRLIKLLESF